MITTEVQHTENGLTGLWSIRLGQYKMGFRFNIYHHGIAFRWLSGHIADTLGVLNRFENTSQQALFIDFDKQELEDVINWISHAQEQYNFDTAYIFHSSNNHYNMMTTELFDATEIREILNQCNIVDDKFRAIYYLHGDNTIRIAPKFSEKESRKVIFIGSLKSEKKSNRVRHNGLSELFHRVFYILPEQNGLDTSTENDLIMKEYETLNW